VTYKVVFTPKARAEAVEVFRWLEERSSDAAARWFVGLEKAVAKLEVMPERHPVAEEESALLGVTIWQMLYGRRRGVYRVLFSIQGDTVYLHHVRHSAGGPIEP
jgi:plasmid stabilization system protein ParE